MLTIMFTKRLIYQINVFWKSPEKFWWMKLRIGLDTFLIFILRYFLINDFILTVVYLTYQIKEINRESANLVARHNNAFPGELCHLQKHSLQAVPVNEILNKVRVTDL